MSRERLLMDDDPGSLVPWGPEDGDTMIVLRKRTGVIALIVQLLLGAGECAIDISGITLGRGHHLEHGGRSHGAGSGIQADLLPAPPAQAPCIPVEWVGPASRETVLEGGRNGIGGTQGEE